MPSLTSYAQEIPQAIVFENFNMEGNHKHFFASDLDLTSGSNMDLIAPATFPSESYNAAALPG